MNGDRQRNRPAARAHTAARWATGVSLAALVASAALVSRAGAAPPDSTAQSGTHPESDATTREPARATTPAFTFVLGLDRMQDDNILQLTPHGFDRFAQNPDPPRFLIVSPDDDISVFRGDARWRTRPLPRRETRVSASLDAYEYQRNDVKNWQQYELSLLQELTASRRHLATLELSWNQLPSYYLGQITDADESFAAGTRIRRPLSYAQRTLAARASQQWARGRLVLGTGFERVRRDYNASFDERDNHNDQWRFTAELSPFRRWGFSTRLTYLTGALDARGDLASSPIRDTDISYDHRGLGGSVSVPWGHGRLRGRIEAAWMPERRAYTTTDKFDVTRYGRINERREITVKVYQRVWGPFEAVATYDHLSSRARFTQGIDFDPDLTDFDQTRTGLMLRGRWDLARR